MAETMNKVVFWDVTPCGRCKSRRFGETHGLHHQCEKNQLVFLRSVLQLLVTANVVPRALILVTLMMEVFLRNVGSYKSHTV
jgi:hypothetical protein